MTSSHPVVIYGVLVVIGTLGGIADSLIFKGARQWHSPSLVGGYVVWLLGISLAVVYFRIDKHGFTAALLIMTLVHVIVRVVIDWWWFEGTFGWREAVGFVLAVAALVVLESRPTDPVLEEGVSEIARPVEDR